MPKGHREPREFTCRACSQPFTTTKVGRATWYCHRPACDEARSPRRRRAQPVPVPEPAPAPAPAPARKAAEQLDALPQGTPPKADTPPKLPPGQLGELLDRTWADVRQRSGAGAVTRHDLRRAIVNVANAQGVAATSAALHALAVEALAWEFRIGGGGSPLKQEAQEARAA